MKDFKMENGNVVCVGETLQFADLLKAKIYERW